MRGTVLAATKGTAGGVGAVGALALVAPLEAAVPIPIPSDLIMLVVGQRAAAGDLPLWVAVLGIELAAVIGTVTLFLLVRGPGRAAVLRLVSRVPGVRDRIDRLAGIVESRGAGVVAVGRATPGFRTASVVGSAMSGLPAGRALVALIAGSTIFVQAHVVLGYVLGDAAAELLDRAKPLAMALIAAVVVIAIVLAVRRRRGRPAAALEGCCPACLAVTAVPAVRRLLDVSPTPAPVTSG